MGKALFDASRGSNTNLKPSRDEKNTRHYVAAAGRGQNSLVCDTRPTLRLQGRVKTRAKITKGNNV